jgi:hypothetical protein
MENTRPNEEEGRISEPNWSERVEDLVVAGDVTAAISFLESLETNLQSRLGSSSSGERTEFGLQLSAALTQLADLYSSEGLSLKSDELRTRSSLIKQRALDCDLASSRSSGNVENQSVASSGLKSDPNVSSFDADGCSSRVLICFLSDFSFFTLLLIDYHGSIKGKRRIPKYLAVIQLLMILQMMIGKLLQMLNRVSYSP